MEEERDETMKKILALTMAMLIMFPCSAAFAINRTFEDGISFDLLITSIYSVVSDGDDIYVKNLLDFPYANNDNFFYSPPVMIYKQNGKVSAIEIDTLIWKKHQSGIDIRMSDYFVFGIFYPGSTEFTADNLSIIRPLLEDFSSKEEPKHINDNYIYYYDEPHDKIIFEYTSR